jgi:hypothetical protein
MRPAGLAAIKMLLNNGLLEQSTYDLLFSKLSIPTHGGQEVVGQLEVAF